VQNRSDDPECEEFLTNREKRLKPKSGQVWCNGCDRYVVADWKKCPVCGTRNNIKRFKK